MVSLRFDEMDQKNNSPEGRPGWVCLLAERERETMNIDQVIALAIDVIFYFRQRQR